MTTSTTIAFNKPTQNIQRAFGLFALLEKLGYTRTNLNPSEMYIVIDRSTKTYYSTAEEQENAMDIPSNYPEIVNNFLKNK